MRNLFPFLYMLLLSFELKANDGAFYGSGNHLIPVTETDISVTKEILTIKKIGQERIEVTVYYEFFNPKEEKVLLVGFEAASPHGDVNTLPKNGLHPYMNDFTVNLNNQILAYEVACVNQSAYYKNSAITTMTPEEIEASAESLDVDFNYVYHFKARFQKGLNIVKHTYSYKLSNSIEYNYHFDYILTAAKRWANKQIDDFTLIVDMGEFEMFNMTQSFFKSSSEWIMNGIGKTSFVKAEDNSYIEQAATKFVVQKGNLIFQKLNFKPAGELDIYSKNHTDHPETFQAATYKLPYSYYLQDMIAEPVNETDRKILKNLPFARRGYVFTNKELQHYYETMTDWYIPNPNYKPDVELLTAMEKEWVKRWE